MTSRAISLSTKAEVSLLLTGDAAVRELNRQYRGKDCATDVLSFPQEDPEILGDVVISVETAAEQASKAKWPLESEIALLGCHGLLHLAGFEDESDDGVAEMELLSRLCLQRAGIELPVHDHPFFTSSAP